MKYWIEVIIILFILLFTLRVALSYTPPDIGSIDLILNTSYTPDSIGSIGLVLEGSGAPPADTCTCPGDGTAHTFDLSDNCVVSSCEAETIDFTGTGNPVNCTGTWTVSGIDTNVAEWVINTKSGCVINLG